MKLKSSLMGLIALCATSILSAGTASAVDVGIAYGKETKRVYITYNGEINATNNKILKAYALSNPAAEWISFQSPGGHAQAGYELGQIIDQLGLKTYVPYGGQCLSACYTAFLGGHEYDIDGVLAAHVAWTKLENQDASEMMLRGQQIAMYDSWYHLANGFNMALPYVITGYTDKSNFVYFTHEDDLKQYYVRDDSVDIGKTPIYEYLDITDPLVQYGITHVAGGAELAVLAWVRATTDKPAFFDPLPDHPGDMWDPRGEW